MERLRALDDANQQDQDDGPTTDITSCHNQSVRGKTEQANTKPPRNDPAMPPTMRSSRHTHAAPFDELAGKPAASN